MKQELLKKGFFGFLPESVYRCIAEEEREFAEKMEAQRIAFSEKEAELRRELEALSRKLAGTEAELQKLAGSCGQQYRDSSSYDPDERSGAGTGTGAKTGTEAGTETGAKTGTEAGTETGSSETKRNCAQADAGNPGRGFPVSQSAVFYGMQAGDSGDPTALHRKKEQNGERTAEDSGNMSLFQRRGENTGESGNR